MANVGTPTSMVFMPVSAEVIGPMVCRRHVIAHNKRLKWHLDVIANRLKQSDGMAVTGIALICIELDDWPAVQNWSMFVIMPFKIV